MVCGSLKTKTNNLTSNHVAIFALIRCPDLKRVKSIFSTITQPKQMLVNKSGHTNWDIEAHLLYYSFMQSECAQNDLKLKNDSTYFGADTHREEVHCMVT